MGGASYFVFLWDLIGRIEGLRDEKCIRTLNVAFSLGEFIRKHFSSEGIWKANFLSLNGIETWKDNMENSFAWHKKETAKLFQ